MINRSSCKLLLPVNERCHFFPFYVADTTEIYEYNEDTGYSHKSNFNYNKSSDYFQEYYTNDIGLANIGEVGKDSAIMIFSVGDSYTYGCGNAIDESYPFLLNWYLNDASESETYEVANLGVNGFGGKQNLLRLKTYVEKIRKPDYVLYLGCDNDYQDDVLFDAGYKHKHLVENNPYWGIFYKPLKFLFQDLHTGRYIKSVISGLRREKIIETDTNNSLNPSVAAQELEVLENLKSYCSKNNIRLIVTWIVETADMKSYNWVKGWTKENNIGFADWIVKVKQFKEMYPQVSMSNPHSAGHYRTWVNQIIAKTLREEIVMTPIRKN